VNTAALRRRNRTLRNPVKLHGLTLHLDAANPQVVRVRGRLIDHHRFIAHRIAPLLEIPRVGSKRRSCSRSTVRAALNDSTPARAKTKLHAMIDGIRVHARDNIEPTFRVPAVRIDCGYMEPTGIEPVTSRLAALAHTVRAAIPRDTRLDERAVRCSTPTARVPLSTDRERVDGRHSRSRIGRGEAAGVVLRIALALDGMRYGNQPRTFSRRVVIECQRATCTPRPKLSSIRLSESN
jgi:hypothetical protein